MCTLLAVLLAHRYNIGMLKMAQIAQAITYKHFKRISNWHMTKEPQRAAPSALVQAISLYTTTRSGEGRTSASERFAIPRHVLQQTYSTRLSDFALEFYSFVTENYTLCYSTPIECTDRDAGFVLEGSYTTRATWTWRSTTPTPTATRRSASPLLRCWGDRLAPYPRPQEAASLPAGRG